MTTHSAIAFTHQSASFEAGIEVARDLIKRLDQKPSFMMLYITIAHDVKKVIEGMQTLLPDIPFCGCSSAGSINQYQADNASHSVNLMGIYSDQIQFTPFLFNQLEKNPYQVGQKIADVVNTIEIKPDENQLLILLPDGFTINANQLNNGINDRIKKHIDIIGGSAGNDYQSEVCYQFCNQEIQNDAVAGVALHGRFQHQCMVTHGSKPIGLFKTITKAEGPFIYEIDGKSAVDFVMSLVGKERFQDLAQSLALLELGEKLSEDPLSDAIINRAIIEHNLEDGSIRLPVEIATGKKVRITYRDKHLVLQRTKDIGQQLITKMKNPESALYLYFDCVGRGCLLLGEASVGIDALQEGIGKNKQLFGFYTFGELGPVGGKNLFHNYSGILVGIEE